MSEKLKPCPFCGSKAKFSPAGFGEVGFKCISGFAECKKCNAMVFAETKAEAIEKWNTRAE